MTFRAGLFCGILGSLFVAGLVGTAWWITAWPMDDAKVTKPTPAATVGKILKEDEITGIKLTPEAEQRLGIQTKPVTKQAVHRVRTYGGEVTVRAGHLIAVAAPLGGILQSPASPVPTPGQTVKKGQPIIQLLPLLTPEARTTIATARVDADGQVNNAATSLEAARIALDRAKRLLNEQAGSQRNVDESQAQYDLAKKTLEGVTARRDLLVRVSGEVERGTAAPITLDAPQDGLLKTMSALNGQNVPAGAQLFEVVDLSHVWVRVPVYVGDLPDIAQQEDGTIGNLQGGRTDQATYPARPVAAPPSANSLAATMDLYYDVDNRTAGFAPGQRVGVAVPLKGEVESLTVPTSAIVYDIHGGTWVYEQTAVHAFTRRRVQVRYTHNGNAVLASGPAAGAPVVTVGAAELFGTEVGFSK